jgi:hypothetical protein
VWLLPQLQCHLFGDTFRGGATLGIWQSELYAFWIGMLKIMDITGGQDPARVAVLFDVNRGSIFRNPVVC